MSGITVKVRDFEATVYEGKWTSDDPIFLRIVETIASHEPSYREMWDPSGDPGDGNLADRVVHGLTGCTIVKVEDEISTNPPGTVL